MEPNDSTPRDYSTISPSAKALLLMKGYTNIPFARQAAALMVAPEKYEPDYEQRDLRFWARVVHFESRYWSIDQLMAGLPIKNILEISSGFSFRGLVAVQQDGVHYIDTDLPEVIELKKQFVEALQPAPNPKSKLEVLPLNALDEDAFESIINRFAPGEPVLIVNEGLLMYLGVAEKEKLCRIIQKVLHERGGYWITADIYLKQRAAITGMEPDDELNRFFEKHNVREQMFESFEAARAFFEAQGFVIDKEAERDPDKLSALPYLIQSATGEQLKAMRQAGRIQATWRM
ncbi:MAG: class I SAM-dependent methyltransferase [Mucilaginibacter sp.]